jgi:hypothetical protein
MPYRASQTHDVVTNATPIASLPGRRILGSMRWSIHKSSMAAHRGRQHQAVAAAHPHALWWPQSFTIRGYFPRFRRWRVSTIACFTTPQETYDRTRRCSGLKANILKSDLRDGSCLYLVSRMTALGQKRRSTQTSGDVRFPRDSRRGSGLSVVRLRARSGPMAPA